MNTNKDNRIERDLLGEISLPVDNLYGIQTQRAKDNFNLSGVPLSHFPELVKALARVKLACAKANYKLNLIEREKLDAIDAAVMQIVMGDHHSAFIVDMIQGGAGTSTNMNANEVIANLGLDYLEHSRGEYQYLHPNNDVNKSQSTNDVYPTAARLAVLSSHENLLNALTDLREAFLSKSEAFSHILKVGRTQLQDAVPMTLGQEFHAFATTLGEDVKQISELSSLLKEVNLGGTAIGTGINASPEYAHLSVKYLSELSGFDLVQASDLVEASSDMGAFVLFSGVLKRLAIKLSKISNDLRLLSMGPRCGLNEINLPAQQPGSSIMPGKVNPVIPEAVSQVSYQVIGNDMAITMAAEAGQLQLNAMEPLIVYNILSSIKLLTQAMNMLNERCVVGITANEDVCQELLDRSIGIITAITPHIGYEKATHLARQALINKCNVIDMIREEQLISEQALNTYISAENLVGLSRN